MTRFLRKVAVLTTLGVTLVLGSAQKARADHECGSSGYDRRGYVSSGYSYRSGSVYYARPSYPTLGHGYSYGEHDSNYRRPAVHIDSSVRYWRPSYPQRSLHHRHHD